METAGRADGFLPCPQAWTRKDKGSALEVGLLAHATKSLVVKVALELPQDLWADLFGHSFQYYNFSALFCRFSLPPWVSEFLFNICWELGDSQLRIWYQANLTGNRNADFKSYLIWAKMSFMVAEHGYLLQLKIYFFFWIWGWLYLPPLKKINGLREIALDSGKKLDLKIRFT